MQYLFPVGFGPSSNTCPRWLPQFLHSTSVRFIPPLLSSFNSMFSFIASEKLGHPVPESNFASDVKSLAPHTLQLKLPSLSVLRCLPLPLGSVPFSLSILYSCSESFSFSFSSFIQVLVLLN